MGWTGIPIYGKLELKEKVKLAVESTKHKVLECSCKHFRKVMVAVQNLDTDDIEVFELLFSFQKDEMLVKEFACGELFETCPKKMMPYLEQAKDGYSKKLLKATLEHNKANQNRLRLKTNEYYVIPDGMPLSNGETAYVFQYLNRKLYSLGYRIDGGLRRRKELVPVESLPTLNSIPKWLHTERIGIIPGRGAVLKSCLDVTDRLTSNVYKNEMAAIHNDYIRELGNHVFVHSDPEGILSHKRISNEELTKELQKYRTEIVNSKQATFSERNIFTDLFEENGSGELMINASAATDKNEHSIKENQLSLF